MSVGSNLKSDGDKGLHSNICRILYETVKEYNSFLQIPDGLMWGTLFPISGDDVNAINERWKQQCAKCGLGSAVENLVTDHLGGLITKLKTPRYQEFRVVAGFKNKLLGLLTSLPPDQQISSDQLETHPMSQINTD